MKIHSVAVVGSLKAVAWYDPKYLWTAGVEDADGNLIDLPDGTTAEYLGGVGQSAAYTAARALLTRLTPDVECEICSCPNRVHATGVFRRCQVAGCQCLNFKARKD